MHNRCVWMIFLDLSPVCLRQDQPQPNFNTHEQIKRKTSSLIIVFRCLKVLLNSPAGFLIWQLTLLHRSAAEPQKIVCVSSYSSENFFKPGYMFDNKTTRLRVYGGFPLQRSVVSYKAETAEIQSAGTCSHLISHLGKCADVNYWEQLWNKEMLLLWAHWCIDVLEVLAYYSSSVL